MFCDVKRSLSSLSMASSSAKVASLRKYPIRIHLFFNQSINHLLHVSCCPSTTLWSGLTHLMPLVLSTPRVTFCTVFVVHPRPSLPVQSPPPFAAGLESTSTTEEVAPSIALNAKGYAYALFTVLWMLSCLPPMVRWQALWAVFLPIPYGPNPPICLHRWPRSYPSTSPPVR